MRLGQLGWEGGAEAAGGWPCIPPFMGFTLGLCVWSPYLDLFGLPLQAASALRLLSGCPEIQRQVSQENQEAAVLSFGNDNLTSKVTFSCSVQVQGEGTQTPLLHGRRVKVTC